MKLNSAGSRLLTVVNVVGTSSSYNNATNTLTVGFGYTADVSLTTVAVSFTSSMSNSNSYFFNTPSTSVTLTTPNNKLLTTFLSAKDILQIHIMGYFFLALMILAWIFVIIGVCFGQSAVGVEWLMVLQICY